MFLFLFQNRLDDVIKVISFFNTIVTKKNKQNLIDLIDFLLNYL